MEHGAMQMKQMFEDISEAVPAVVIGLAIFSVFMVLVRLLG